MVSTFEFADNVVGILIKSDVNNELIDEVHDVISSHIEEHGQINLFVEIEVGVKIFPSALLKDLIFKISNASNFNKIAVVTNLNWFQNVLEIKDLLMSAEIRSFDVKSRIKAISWIAE